MVEAKSDQTPLTPAVRSIRGNENDFEIELRGIRQLDVGPLDGAVLVTPVLSDGTRLPARRIEVDGAVVEDVQPVPTEVVLGIRQLGDTAEESIPSPP